MPSPRPTAVSKAKMASIVSLPARLTLRGGVRPRSVLKSVARVGRARDSNASTTFPTPRTVVIVQVKASTSRQ